MSTLLAREPEAAPVLAVDDDASVRGLLELGLVSFGYRVRVAASVPEARSVLRSHACSVVLCDYEMPGGTGLDLLSYVSQVHPDLPFILLTGQDETGLARSAISAGAIDFVSKPFELRQLARVIEQNQVRVARDRERAAQLEDEVLTGTIRALVAAVDAKDPHTACHSERVCRLARQFGAALALAPDRLRVLEFAALMHDVGKIGVPEEILRKPAALSAEEWAVIRQHPVRSAEIVGQVRSLAEVATVVRHHHEHLDGSGYPDGLAGEAIPLLARVIALADAYEVLTSDRAYRRALAPLEARRVMRGALGTHFDPQLGSRFLELPDLV